MGWRFGENVAVEAMLWGGEIRTVWGCGEVKLTQIKSGSNAERNPKAGREQCICTVSQSERALHYSPAHADPAADAE